MQFFSTRNSNLRANPATAITSGIAPDGGLYLPECFPAFPMERLASMSGNEISVAVLSRLFDDFTEEELSRYVSSAYASFENGDIAPLVPVGNSYILELFHGPTCAFKDVALSLLPYLLTAAQKKCGITDDICILTATSGDTGSAALSGFSDVAGTKIVVFYPDGGVSPMQKRQMTTVAGKNTKVIAVRGNFDDAQSGVKAIFASSPKIKGVRFSSANSINIGRLAPQIAYYFKAYRDLLAAGKITLGDPVRFVVPTGNFGDILAGIFAMKMGLPVEKFVCASNENRVLTDFFETGTYDRRRDFHLTSSPSMDILISSNLERLLAMMVGTEKTADYMKKLSTEGHYSLDAETKSALGGLILAASADDAETRATIGKVYKDCGYLMDPHTAVAYAAMEKCADGCTVPTVVLSTASPYKFTSAVLRALGEEPGTDGFSDLDRVASLTGTKIPAPLDAVRTHPMVHKDVIDVAMMENAVVAFASGEGK